MKSLILSLIATAGLAGGYVALADDDYDDDTISAMTHWRPHQALEQLARDRGWTIRELDIDSVFYVLEGVDSAGRDIEVKINPIDLSVVEVEQHDQDDDDDEDDDDGDRWFWGDDDDDEDDAGAPAVDSGTPPNNGLFEPGSQPQVQVQ